MGLGYRATTDNQSAAQTTGSRSTAVQDVTEAYSHKTGTRFGIGVFLSVDALDPDERFYRSRSSPVTNRYTYSTSFNRAVLNPAELNPAAPSTLSRR